MIRAVFLRPLPFPDQHRLVMLSQGDGLMTPASFVDWEAQSGIFERMEPGPGWPITWPRSTSLAAMGARSKFAADAQIDWGVLTFAAAITLVTAILCGLTPIAHLRTSVIPSMMQARLRSHTESPRWRMQALVAGQVARAVVLSAGAGLLIRTLAKLEAVDPGFRADRVLTMSMDFTSSPFRGPGNQQPYVHELMTRISSLPGVRRVGVVSEPPQSR